MKNSTSKRILKVCYGHYSYSSKRHPVINLGGKYLTMFDFKIGDFVEITLNKGCITIVNIGKNK